MTYCDETWTVYCGEFPFFLTPMGGGRAVLPPLSDRARAGAVSAVPAYSPASVEQAP